MANHFEPAERGLRDHVALWRRRAAIILGVAALALAAGLVMALVPAKQYQATASVLFPVEPAGQPGQDAGQVRFDPNRVIQTEAVFAASEPVRSRAEARVGAGGSLSARALKDTDVIFLTATAPDPDRAAQLANAAAAAYVELRSANDRPDAVGGVQVIEPARTPSAASSPALARNALFSLAVGLVLGLVAAYAVDHLDDRVTDCDDLERVSGLPVLGSTVDGARSPSGADTESGSGPDSTHGLADRSPVPPVDRRHSGLRAVALDDPAVGAAGHASGLASLLDGAAADTARVLLVPRGEHGRDVRQAVEVLAKVGVNVAAAVLVESAYDVSRRSR